MSSILPIGVVMCTRVVEHDEAAFLYFPFMYINYLKGTPASWIEQGVHLLPRNSFHPVGSHPALSK